MNTISDKIYILLLCFFIIGFIFLIIHTLIYDCILPIIKYFSDDGSDIKKELIKIGVSKAELAQFKRIKIYKGIYKSSIPLTVDKESNETSQYFELWDIYPHCRIIFVLYTADKKSFKKIYHKITTNNLFKD